ncbi:MAG: GNAT family N-acetyltransferase [Burkholderiaceae bacterium]|nr:GNAT family N-acetyltransferase [Burkholderiaceae bacterium]
MLIETERLILRRFTPDDAEAYLPLVSDPEVNRYTAQDLVETVEQARQILLDYPIRDYETIGYGRMACIEKSSGRLVGFSGMKYLANLQETDIGYRFVRDAWGKGYATESASVLMQQCMQEFGLRRVIGLAYRQNTGSTKVLQKLGLVYEREIELDGATLDLFATPA